MGERVAPAPPMGMQTTTKPSFKYESIEFDLNTGQSDYDLDSNQSTFLAKFGLEHPSQVRIRTNQTISVKLNTTDDHAVTIASTDTPFDIRGVVIKNMFLSNSSGSTAAVKLLFQEVEN